MHENTPGHFRQLTFLILLGLLAAATSADERSVGSPNIVVVMGDDHAQWALGSHGLTQIQTPNLDWLAKKGVHFTNAFSPAPVCSPARASFHTGKMPSQHGVHDFLSEEERFDADWLSDETLLSQRLKTAGYRTGLFGKWHATTDSRQPQRGFDRWLSYDAFVAGWQNQYVHSGTVHFSSDGKRLDYTGVQASFLTSEVIRFIDASQDAPFFVSLNFAEPHSPFEGLPERLVSKYRGLTDDIVPKGAASDLARRSEIMRVPDNHDEQFAQYLAAISLIDEQVGRLLDALDSRDLLNNTIFVYTSDHGLLVGHYGLYGKTNATNPANFYEETIRIPMIVYGPDELVRNNQARDEYVDLLDLHATVLDFAGVGSTGGAGSGPGRSLRILLSGTRNAEWRQEQFAERGNARMVTDGRWKLVRYHHRDGSSTDLWYDLVHPLGERADSAAPRAAVRDRLIGALEGFFRKYETPEHSGRTVWTQPAPNARECEDLGQRCDAG